MDRMQWHRHAFVATSSRFHCTSSRNIIIHSSITERAKPHVSCPAAITSRTMQNLFLSITHRFSPSGDQRISCVSNEPNKQRLLDLVIIGWWRTTHSYSWPQWRQNRRLADCCWTSPVSPLPNRPPIHTRPIRTVSNRLHLAM
jgi:hypothetical protein